MFSNYIRTLIIALSLLPLSQSFAAVDSKPVHEVPPIAVSQNTRWALILSPDKTSAALHELSGEQSIKELRGPLVGFGNTDTTKPIWDLTSPSTIPKTYPIEFSPSGQFVSFTKEDGTILTWEIAKLNEQARKTVIWLQTILKNPKITLTPDTATLFALHAAVKQLSKLDQE